MDLGLSIENQKRSRWNWFSFHANRDAGTHLFPTRRPGQITWLHQTFQLEIRIPPSALISIPFVGWLATDTANYFRDFAVDHFGALVVSLCPFHELKLDIALVGVLHVSVIQRGERSSFRQRMAMPLCTDWNVDQIFSLVDSSRRVAVDAIAMLGSPGVVQRKRSRPTQTWSSIVFDIPQRLCP